MNKLLPLIGSIILSYLLYKRLFKTRLPREIYTTNDLFIISTNIFLIITSVVLLLLTLYTVFLFIQNKEVLPTKNKLILKIEELYNPLHLWTNSLVALDIIVKNKMPYYDHNKTYLDLIIMFFGKTLCKNIIILLTIIIISQSIVIISLFIDIVIKHKFYYFYKMLWLFIFPLINQYVIYSIKAYLETNLTSLNEDVLILKVIKKTDFTNDTTIDDFHIVTVMEWYEICKSTADDFLCANILAPVYVKGNHVLDTIMLNYCVDIMNELFKIQSFLDLYSVWKAKTLAIFNILRFSAYIFCWSFLLYLIL